jgi:4-hydroxy-2-oxoheptanedioate aldolase
LTEETEKRRPRLNRMIELFEAQIPALGIFVLNIGSRGAAVMASSALDFVIIEMEHTPFDPAKLEGYLLAMTDKRRILEKASLQPDVIPFVRIPASGRERMAYLVKQVLDLGVFGVVAPHVNNADEALETVRAMRYAQAEDARDFNPPGLRGVGHLWAARYWGLPAPEYAERADLWPLDPRGELILWCMVETREGLRNCRAIAQTPGVGGILIGTSDLSFSLEGVNRGPKAEGAVQEILGVTKEVGVPCGIVCGPDEVAARLKQGFSFLAVGADLELPGSVERALQIGREYTARKL